MRSREEISEAAKNKSAAAISELMLEVLLDIREKTEPSTVYAPYIETQNVTETPKRGRPKKVNKNETPDSSS